jgi:hypothetical protein
LCNQPAVQGLHRNLDALSGFISSLSLSPSDARVLLDVLKPLALTGEEGQETVKAIEDNVVEGSAEVVTVEDATVENATVANVGDVEEDNAPAYNASLYDWADQTYGYHIPDDGAVGPFYCVTRGLRVGVFASW